MAGVSIDTRRDAVTRALRLALAALVALLALGAFASNASAEAKKSATARKSAKKAQCEPAFTTLYPPATGSGRFEMMIRINTLADAYAWSNLSSTGNPIKNDVDPTGGLKPRVQANDIFLINNRFGNDAATQQQIATQLRTAFPCNRIFALNGLSLNPLSTGYSFSLINAPEVSALLLDWEKMDWDTARQTSPGTPPWVDSPFNSMLPRLKAQLTALANTVLASGTGKRIGLVPFARADWQLGIMARTIDRQAARIVAGGRGFQSSQTQKACQDSASSMQSTIKGLFGQYKSANFKKIKPKKKGGKPHFKKLKPKTNKLNLGVQISFTATPNPSSSDPVKSVSPSRAAECTQAAIFQKAGSILYWARPSDMKVMLADPRVCALRPSPTGIC